MAKPDVRMDYPKMQKMSKEFSNAAKQLDRSMSRMKKVAQTMDDGGLQGEAGSAFVEAIRQKLIPAMQKLEDKMNELSKDVKMAEQETKKGVATAKGRFSN